MTDYETIETQSSHPLEEVLDIASGTTMVEQTTAVPSKIVTTEVYDDKDKEIEEQLQEVFEAAMTQYELTSGDAELVEGKYKARNSEVAIQALNAALAAINTKANVKTNKDKVIAKQTSAPNTLNQNLFVGDRNDLLKLLDGEK